MSLDSYESIFSQFPSVSAEEWKNKIIKDLKGESFDKLIWHTKEDIEVLPFYTKEDNEKYRLQIPPKQTNGWQITERIQVEDVTTANKAALHALQNGAQAIVFNLQYNEFGKEQIQCLVEGILLEVAPVTFEHYTDDNKNVLEAIVKNSCPVVVYSAQQDSISDELAATLKDGILQNTSNLHVHFYCCQNYFFEIAKLRAFRWLWKQVCELKQWPSTIFIQSETSPKNFNADDEYSNILRNTTAAMSAILGGCDGLIINSHDTLIGESPFGKNIARNIHHILQHESYFNDIQDAAKGSYYLEYLTYQLCKKSWEKLSESGFARL